MTHNPTTDTIRAAYRSKVAGQPQLTREDREQALKLLELAKGWAAEAWKVLRVAPHLAEPVERAGLALRSVAARIQLDGPSAGVNL